jgi:glycosyltransferase involved in cell wall biosynthesis
LHLNKSTKISIITVVYNGEKYLEKTIRSIINQTYENIEYVIIDGGSTDGTVNIIKKYENNIDYWISESDNGIYDAMNKGVDLASGEWINFMNAGDVFYSKEVVNNIFENEESIGYEIDEYDLIVGSAVANASWGMISLPTKALWKGFTHQSIFTKSSLLSALKFNVNYISAADYDFIYRTLMLNKHILMLEQIVSEVVYIDTGFSAVNEKISKMDVLRSILKNGLIHKGMFVHFMYHFIMFVANRFKSILFLFSPMLLNYLRKIRNHDAKSNE